MRGAVKDAYHIRERGFDTPANRRRIGGAGGLGAVYPHPSQERKHRASVPPFPHPRATRANSSCTRVYQLSRRNAGATAWAGRGITPRDKLTRHGPAVRARPAPVVRSCFQSAARDRSPDYIQINIYQRPRERGPIYAQRKQAGQQHREAPAAASGGDACRVPARLMRCGRLVPRLAPTVPGGVRGARLRGGMPPACVNRRPMDAQKMPRWPRAAGMF